MNTKLTYFLLISTLIVIGNITSSKAQSIARISATCVPASSRTTLEINQIRANYGTASSWWFNPGNSSAIGFEVPKGSGKQSLFAGSIWIGAKDFGGNLKVAAQTYRQASVLGVGFWPGPLDLANAATTSPICQQFDRLWKVSADQIRTHIAMHNSPGYVMPTDILEWPASGPANYDPTLAPFVDVNSNGVYDPQNGDYPAIYGDEALWSVYNDKGNTPGSGSVPMGIEIQEMVFGFDRTGPLSDALFHHYKIINRSTSMLDSFHVGMFIDPDLGNGADDFVGCDVTRSMGYVYNGDADDEGTVGYGTTPPAQGVVLFEGLYSDSNDGRDNNLDGVIDNLVADCSGTPRTERYKMWHFHYFNNDGTPTGNPTIAIHVFNYLTSRWKDGTAVNFGGTGYTGLVNPPNKTRYMFPGASDPVGYGQGGSIASPVNSPFNWSEFNIDGSNTSNTPADRRFVMGSGTTTMFPGAINFMTIGNVWSRASSGDQFASVQSLNTAVDQIQAMVDNCSFYTLNAPSIFERESTSKLSIYPNPAKDVVYLKGDMTDARQAVVTIYNLNGQKIKSFTHEVNHQTEIPVDIQELSAGMYLVQAQAGAQTFMGKLLVR